jgi:hypothetical protein
MALIGTISNAGGSPGNKDAIKGYQSLLLATIIFPPQPDGTQGPTLRLSTHPLNAAEGGVQYNGNDYYARLLEQNIDAVQAMSENGIDIPPNFSLKIADADRFVWSNFEQPYGFKGAVLNIDLVLYEADSGNFSSDSYRKFTGLCNPAQLTDESTITISSTSKLNMQKVLLPVIPIERRCPWIFPVTAADRIAALGDPSSDFFPCGYSADVPGGSGNGGFTICDYTRGGCQARGMFSKDGGGKVTGHFGGVEFDPPLWWKSKSYLEGKTISGINSPNENKYNSYAPLVYGQTFVDGVVLNVIGDANSTRMEVMVCFGDVGNASAANMDSGGVKMVIVNDIALPFDFQSVGGPAPADKLFLWRYVNHGGRDSAASKDAGYTDTGGNALGDPYGNLCVVELVVPKVLTDSQSIPRVQILTLGPQIRVYNGPGLFDYTMQRSSNPIWVLMNLLTLAAWNYTDFNIQTFVTAAAVCDVQINYTNNAGNVGNINADGSPHLRYSCSLAVSQRQTAADTIRGIRNSCKAMLVPNDLTGLLQVFIKQTLADQQTSPITGSNSIGATGSRNASGQFSSGYSAYDFDEGSILENSDGSSSLSISQRTILDSPNRISVNFQDQDNQYVTDSMTEVDPVDIGRSGQTVIAGVQANGINSYDQGQRVFEGIFAETYRGNPRGDSGGTMVFEFQTSQKVAHLQVGQICTFSHQQLEFSRQLVRLIKIQPSRDYEITKVTLQFHSDAWYADTYGQAGNPIYSQSNKHPLTRPPYGWQPDQEAPLASDQIFTPTDFTFGMAQQYETSSDGSAIPKVVVTGKLPVNSFASLQPPLIGLQGNVGVVPGVGTIAPGTVVSAVICPADGSTPPLLGPPTPIPCTIAVPAGGSYLTVNIPVVAWPGGAPPSGPTGYSVFAGPNPNRMTWQASGLGTPSSVVISALNTREYGVPDVMFDHLQLRAKRQIHGGVWGLQVNALTSKTLTFNLQTWDVNQWAGYDLTIIGRLDSTASLPVWNFRIVSNTADTLTVSSATKDLTNLSAVPSPTGNRFEIANAKRAALAAGAVTTVRVNVGDVAVMRCKPSTFSALTIGDANFINSVAPTGLVTDEGAFVARIFAGTGRGQWRNVVGNTSTVYTVDRAWDPIPDATSRFWIEESAWQPPVDSSPAQNTNPQGAYIGNLPVPNFDGAAIVVQALALDSQGNASFEQDSPVRDFYIFGQALAFGKPKMTFVFGRGTDGGPADIGVGDNTNLLPVPIGGGGLLYGWQAICETAPVGSSMIIDILLNGKSVFSGGKLVTIPDGSTSLITGTAFSSSTLTVKPGDTIKATVTQVGSSTPGQSATVYLYWS